jgi:hypothetical protein
MTDPVETGLNRLRIAARSDCDLGGLETAVWDRVEARARSDIFRGKTLQIQLAVTCAALIVGLLMAEFVDSRAPMFQSETAVLSDDSGLAPSVRLAGGA